MRAAIAATTCLALALTACAGSSRPKRAVLERIDRVLATAPGKAQPSKIVATELAYARLSKEKGHWTAAREYAAPGAQIHGANGPVDALAVFKVVPEPNVKWSVRNVWMSCDATTAVSWGRYVDGDGRVGGYATVWQRQPDREYRWIYDIALPDDPQPPPPEPEAPIDGNAIVVTALDAIEGKVADCADPQRIYRNASAALAAGNQSGGAVSPDKTLEWRWFHSDAGARGFEIDWWRGEEREVAFTLPGANPGATQTNQTNGPVD